MEKLLNFTNVYVRRQREELYSVKLLDMKQSWLWIQGNCGKKEKKNCTLWVVRIDYRSRRNWILSQRPGRFKQIALSLTSWLVKVAGRGHDRAFWLFLSSWSD
ncbi:uncharacterized protein A4U43_C04F540 [Asparagus officinalis]|uniref:Uncharacterized protein n=1 Tax=Asparagus officinalis TaxID=4686 RepID=A0A5P1EZ02_ASPOF|nr:uncharacterized protein A4U43_C04F540 [Asparagus officinalis]